MKPKPVRPKAARAAKPAPKAVAPIIRVPHDRGPVPAAALVPAADALDRGLLAVAGFALLLVALGGAVVLVAARRQLLLAALGLLALAAPAAHAAAPPVSSALTGTSGANGWFTSNVTIKWTVVDNGDLQSTTCPVAEQITAEGSNERQCTAVFTWGSVTSPVVTIKIDKTAPVSVYAALARAPDSGGWFNKPIAAVFSGGDAVSGIAGCSSPTYAGTDSASAALVGTCTDVAGNTSASASIGFKYDATAPTIAPAVDRPPDGRGWYRKPLTVSFTGTDLTSGIASCTAPTRYAGPDLATAAVVGSCRDAAGNEAQAGHAFQYDATAPKLAEAKASVEKGVAKIVWTRPADAVLVELERTPGVNGRPKTIVYRGSGAIFTDKTVRDGVSYRYEISAADVAGNVTKKVVTAALGRPALYRPAAGAVVTAPPALTWKAAAGARFYNVQLHRNGVKVLSVWPARTSLQLARTWRFGGKAQRLVPGAYRWYVWGARGTREQARYGRLLGSSTFVVKR
ncbi:MAG: hypothetical protein ACXWZB_04360 [Gaiellaceae bacterium]